MHISPLLLLLTPALSLAAPTTTTSPPYEITDYISDCISSFCVYTFSITYTPPTSASPPLCEPAFNTSCSYTTDAGPNYVACTDSSVQTTGDFSSGIELVLTVAHSWTVPATAAKLAGTFTRSVSGSVQLYLGSAGYPASFELPGGVETFVPVNDNATTSSSSSTRVKKMKSRFAVVGR